MGAPAFSAAVGRRFVLAGMASAGLFVASTARATGLPEDRLFAIFRKGEQIGTHSVTFRSAAGGGLTVRHAIDIVVAFAFIPVYRYEQKVEDLWRDGRLVATDADTDENGERSFVRVRERGGLLVCEGPRGVRHAPLGTMNDLSYWNVAIVGQRGLIDCQRGELEPLDLEGGELDTVSVGGRPVTARRWRTNPQGKRGGEVWYDEAGRIVKAVVRTRGEVLDYRLVA
mgnify:CR=1 FL=1|jgi:hypothetical protein